MSGVARMISKAAKHGAQAAKHCNGQVRFGSTSGPVAEANEKAAKGVTREIFLGLGLGFVCAIGSPLKFTSTSPSSCILDRYTLTFFLRAGIRSALQNDLNAFAAKK